MVIISSLMKGVQATSYTHLFWAWIKSLISLSKRDWISCSWERNFIKRLVAYFRRRIIILCSGDVHAGSLCSWRRKKQHKSLESSSSTLLLLLPGPLWRWARKQCAPQYRPALIFHLVFIQIWLSLCAHDGEKRAQGHWVSPSSRARAHYHVYGLFATLSRWLRAPRHTLKCKTRFCENKVKAAAPFPPRFIAPALRSHSPASQEVMREMEFNLLLIICAKAKGVGGLWSDVATSAEWISPGSFPQSIALIWIENYLLHRGKNQHVDWALAKTLYGRVLDRFVCTLRWVRKTLKGEELFNPISLFYRYASNFN
jgi:hypothetical protein